FEAYAAGARRRRVVRAIGGRLSWRGDRRARRLVRARGLLHAGARALRADTGADGPPPGPRARRAEENTGAVPAFDPGGLHGRVRLAILVPGVRTDSGRQCAHAGAG